MVEFTLEDLDNTDEIYGPGDLFTIRFDRATDRGGPERPTKGAEPLIDAMFAFSAPLGMRYSGEWADSSTLTITVVNATGEGVTSDGAALATEQLDQFCVFVLLDYGGHQI